MTLLIVLGCLVAGAGVIAGAQVVALGRKQAIAKAYSDGWWACHDEYLDVQRTA